MKGQAQCTANMLVSVTVKFDIFLDPHRALSTLEAQATLKLAFSKFILVQASSYITDFEGIPVHKQWLSVYSRVNALGAKARWLYCVVPGKQFLERSS